VIKNEHLILDIPMHLIWCAHVQGSRRAYSLDHLIGHMMRAEGLVSEDHTSS
jgi:hypothetical protein